MVHYQTSRSTRQLFEISLSPRQRTTTVAQNHYNLINATQGSSCKNTCWCKNTCLSVPTSHGRFKCNFLFLQPGNHDHPAPPTIRSSVRVRPKLWKRKHIFTIWMIQYKGPHHHPPHLRSLYPSSFPPFFSAVLSAVTNFDDSLANTDIVKWSEDMCWIWWWWWSWCWWGWARAWNSCCTLVIRQFRLSLMQETSTSRDSL